MADPTPVFSAVSSSARQLLLLLRCISFAKKAQVRISPEGLRFSTEEGSVMEAFVFLESALFTSYTYTPAPPPSSQDDPPDPPTFEINLQSLLETLNIFSLSDLNASSSRRPGGGGDYDGYSTHRLARHANMNNNAFTNPAFGLTGVCTFSYTGEGHPLSIHLSESGVTTTCDLTTYGAETAGEEIPFNRDALALKTILRSTYLLDAVMELSNLAPAHLTLTASPTSQHSAADLSLSASGPLGSVTVDFTATAALETPILETFHCPEKCTASFQFALIKHAQRAMAVATKVSVRVDGEGVLSMQFLVEVGGGGNGGNGGEECAAAFVDFRVVPLLEDEVDGDRGRGSEGSQSE
ncbi:hypothetical protein LTR08_006275 [Meristemomyces frigidus]|nr:hypothetical protein LTR08_006275 [Meristemomyces frigidus]